MTTAATLDDAQDYLLEWPETAEYDFHRPAQESEDGSRKNRPDKDRGLNAFQSTKPKAPSAERKLVLRSSLEPAPLPPTSSQKSNASDVADSEDASRPLTILEKRTKAQKIRRILKRQGKPPPNDPKHIYAKDELDFLNAWYEAFGVEFEVKDLMESFNAYFHDRVPRRPIGLGERFKRELAKMKKTSGVRAGLLLKPKNESKYKVALDQWKKTLQGKLHPAQKRPTKKRKRQSNSDKGVFAKKNVSEKSANATQGRVPVKKPSRIVLHLNLVSASTSKRKADSHDENADKDTDERRTSQ